MMTEDQRKLLGSFVRARRESVAVDRPGRRRTPGLRREELADRANISATWVTWIEQGRDVRPSAHTLDHLAQGLCLSRAERQYLFSLAGREDPADPFAILPQDASASIDALVDCLPWPAYGLNPIWNVTCANGYARELFTGLFDETEAPNLLRYFFTHPSARILLPDWDQRALRILAEFRRDYGRTVSDPRTQSVVDWLKANSETFAAGWEKQAVSEREGGRRSFNHAAKGLLHYTQHTLANPERPDFKLVTLQPEG
ncbi:helix-turn-helix domain-containing protein [Altererythrobacter indicus]|uniref:Helix-turn-helix domain-containing protein n=1 Tax=Altericroceibacterium indicum TaxID=374177 RepID=A0A845A3L5_9SPHN|nr:helix-turn-helix transcriptional regulator [Altericroceibacterium indicum]MXP24770.1 helix-turn-helix domain-containing protein [Altericroceibacterium indicum]